MTVPSESEPDVAAEILERLGEKLGGKASVSTVFGEPVVCDGVTVIPVAKVGFGLGVGMGKGRKSAGLSLGGGGGGGVSATPCGYIVIKDGNTTFKPIRDSWVDVLIPLAAVVLGSAAPRILRRLRRT
jgi:uncharacterized spore protein YtfJ